MSEGPGCSSRLTLEEEHSWFPEGEGVGEGTSHLTCGGAGAQVRGSEVGSPTLHFADPCACAHVALSPLLSCLTPRHYLSVCAYLLFLSSSPTNPSSAALHQVYPQTPRTFLQGSSSGLRPLTSQSLLQRNVLNAYFIDGAGGEKACDSGLAQEVLREGRREGSSGG